MVRMLLAVLAVGFLAETLPAQKAPAKAKKPTMVAKGNLKAFDAGKGELQVEVKGKVRKVTFPKGAKITLIDKEGKATNVTPRTLGARLKKLSGIVLIEIQTCKDSKGHKHVIICFGTCDPDRISRICGAVSP
jgi:hypothetical protein